MPGLWGPPPTRKPLDELPTPLRWTDTPTAEPSCWTRRGLCVLLPGDGGRALGKSFLVRGGEGAETRGQVWRSCWTHPAALECTAAPTLRIPESPTSTAQWGGGSEGRGELRRTSARLSGPALPGGPGPGRHRGSPTDHPVPDVLTWGREVWGGSLSRVL